MNLSRVLEADTGKLIETDYTRGITSCESRYFFSESLTSRLVSLSLYIFSRYSLKPTTILSLETTSSGLISKKARRSIGLKVELTRMYRDSREYARNGVMQVRLKLS